MGKFSRDAAREVTMTLRLTREQSELLEQLRQRLQLATKADVMRTALDYWLDHAPETREAKRKGK